jgi:hypothetical protein
MDRGLVAMIVIDTDTWKQPWQDGMEARASWNTLKQKKKS